MDTITSIIPSRNTMITAGVVYAAVLAMCSGRGAKAAMAGGATLTLGEFLRRQLHTPKQVLDDLSNALGGLPKKLVDEFSNAANKLAQEATRQLADLMDFVGLKDVGDAIRKGGSAFEELMLFIREYGLLILASVIGLQYAGYRLLR